MDHTARYRKQLDEIGAALQAKLKLRPAPFAALVARSRSRLPRRVYKNAQALAEAERFADHPKLARTLDFPSLDKSADLVRAHLKTIDLADERKGRILSLLGSLSINLIGLAILLIAVLIWRGYL